jgi:hypothetical protein
VVGAGDAQLSSYAARPDTGSELTLFADCVA